MGPEQLVQKCGQGRRVTSAIHRLDRLVGKIDGFTSPTGVAQGLDAALRDHLHCVINPIVRDPREEIKHPRFAPGGGGIVRRMMLVLALDGRVAETLLQRFVEWGAVQGAGQFPLRRLQFVDQFQGQAPGQVLRLLRPGKGEKTRTLDQRTAEELFRPFRPEEGQQIRQLEDGRARQLQLGFDQPNECFRILRVLDEGSVECRGDGKIGTLRFFSLRLERLHLANRLRARGAISGQRGREETKPTSVVVFSSLGAGRCATAFASSGHAAGGGKTLSRLSPAPNPPMK